VPERLSHLDDEGGARMVDVGAKLATERRAVADAIVRMEPATAAMVQRGDAPKGDVVSTARIAGIQAAKRTADLIPLCHSPRCRSSTSPSRLTRARARCA